MAGKNDIDKILESIRELRAAQKQADERSREADERGRKIDERLDRLGKQIGDLTGGWGRFVEDLMAPGIQARFEEAGIKVTRRAERLQVKENGRIVAEHDVVLFGTGPRRRKTVILVSVKSRVKSADINELIADIDAFFERFPIYRRHDLMGAIAGVGVHHSVRRYAEKTGIYVIDSGKESARIVNRPGFEPRVWRQG